MKTASLKHLANLSQQLSKHKESDSYIQEALSEVKMVLNFDFCVLYKVNNVVQEQIILEVMQTIGENDDRPDLVKGRKICISLTDPNPMFINEASCYTNLRTSNIPVPGKGSDIAGFFQTPEEWGHGFILSCDHIQLGNQVSEEDFYAFEVVNNMLIGALTRNFYAHMATHDSLTGCFNKKMIQDQLDTALYKCSRSSDSWLSVAMIDIDHFKQVNDTYGHLQGDCILEEFVQVLNRGIRTRTDCLGRYGGEEFLLVLENTSPQSAHYVLDRLRKSIFAHNFSKVNICGESSAEEGLKITASIGLMSIHSIKSELPKAEIIDQADKALYISKSNGRNQVSIAQNWEI